MREIIQNIQCVLMVGCFLCLAFIGIVAFAYHAIGVARKFCRTAALGLLAIGAVLYGGSKARITYPRTDMGVAYLVDAGSYVTNDFVHIEFRRFLAPDSAPILVDRRPIDSTEDLDWEPFFADTFGNVVVPFDLPCRDATNWNWCVYTTWTPGPAVQTNGVWHLTWQTDGKGHRYIIPIRTGVYTDCDKIAPSIEAKTMENE